MQKNHYSWPLPFELLTDELLYEYVRLTHAVSLRGELFPPNTEENKKRAFEELERAFEVCKRVNADPKTKRPASIGINYSVWHAVFGKELPPTDKGQTSILERCRLEERMKAIQEWLDKANKKFKSDIAITAVLFDSERFHVCKHDPIAIRFDL